MSSENIQPKKINLGRGGVIINTKIGFIQFGIPPETIKDCMLMGIPIPSYYVFPESMFDRDKGINTAEAEFPAYYNYFIQKKVVKFVATKDQEERIRRVFQQTLLGPKESDIRKEISATCPIHLIPDFHKEASALRTFHQVDDLFHFIHFSQQQDHTNIAHLGDGVVIKHKPGGDFIVLEDGVEVERAPSKAPLPSDLWQTPVLADKEPFDPPQFGVTILGSGHGFDPRQRTAGFVLWINKRGIMVDPPLNSRGILQMNGVPSRLIDSMIITHCHADHDSGALQKLLEETQISFITTPLILTSFLKKYSALTGLSEDYIRRLFVFRPAIIGEPFGIHGGEIRFFYSIHTIPCIGFEVYYGGKSMFYSGDTCYDPNLIQSMKDRQLIPPERADFWINFKWHHNLILHEAGVPPIHTPVAVLSALPEDVKTRVYLVHTSQKAVPPDTGLRIAPDGVENTIELDVTPHVHAEAIELLKVIDNIDMFKVFTLSQAREILQNAIPKQYQAGETIIEKGSPGSMFFVITAGIATILDPGSQLNKNLVAGDYFGEMSLVTGEARTATVVAKTHVDVVCFRKEDFLSILRGNNETVESIINLSHRRQEPSREIIERNSVFQRMTNLQKTKLQAILHRVQVKKGQLLWKAGHPAAFGYLVGEGQLQFRDKPDLAPFSRGAFLAEVNALLAFPGQSNLATTVEATSDGWGYSVQQKDFVEFLNRNPGMLLSLIDTNFADIDNSEHHDSNQDHHACRF